MWLFLFRRVLAIIPTVLLISLVAFVIIQLPPGDFLTTYIANLSRQGQTVEPAQIVALKQRYALDQPLVAQYVKWLGNIVLHGDFGHSMLYGKSVSELIGERLPLTLTLGVLTMLFGWAVALPAGIYSAVRRYSVGDYGVTALAFVGIAVPGFLFALIAAYIQFRYFDMPVGGIFSPEYVDAAWNLGKVLDLLSHLWLPVVVLALAGIGGTIRILRANLLDELRKPYVVTARARGLSERRLILTYPVRVALNPFIATVGWLIPALFDGEVLVAKVLGLETTGPLLLSALESQDMYLAGSIVFIACLLTVIGTLVSDILLAVVDPRVRAGYA
jgi:peptide/nickel transport system permease protein